MNKEVYLDHAASGELDPEVLRYLVSLYEKKLGNASSIHLSGVRGSREVELARSRIASKIGCSPDEVIFTSGATESNNLALHGFFAANRSAERNEVLISAIEHASVEQAARLLEGMGAQVQRIPVDRDGRVEIAVLEKLISQRTLLVSIVHANSEIGVIQDLTEISRLCRERGVAFHSDGAQAFCKTDFHFANGGVDLYSISSHKIHGPKGVGALIVRKGIQLRPLFGGGGQESGLRSGTLPVELIGAFAKAAEIWTSEDLSRILGLRSRLVSELMQLRSDVRFNGSLDARLATNLNFAIPGLPGKTVLQALDRAGVRVSAGSACNSGKKTPSAVLKALGQTDEEAYEAIRVSFGRNTTDADIDILLETIRELAVNSSD